MANSLHVKKGDRVKVIAGKDKGKIGEVIAVYPKDERVVVEGVNVRTKHRPETQNAQGKKVGGLTHTEMPIHVSNVQLVVGSGKDQQLTRVGYKRVEVSKRRPDGSEYTAERSVRVARKTGEEI